jgi:hypothetical protein
MINLRLSSEYVIRINPHIDISVYFICGEAKPADPKTYVANPVMSMLKRKATKNLGRNCS